MLAGPPRLPPNDRLEPEEEEEEEYAYDVDEGSESSSRRCSLLVSAPKMKSEEFSSSS